RNGSALFQLHLSINAIRIEDRFGRARVRASQRLRIRGFKELQKRARKTRLLEHPEAAVGLGVVVPLAAQLFLESLTLRWRDESALDSQRAGHGQSTLSGKVSRLFFTNDMNLSASAPSTMR